MDWKMLLKIKTADLKMGMHIKELCGSWLEHPFWRTSFMLSNEKDLERMISSGVDEVWIDTSKGVSPNAGVNSKSLGQEESAAQMVLEASAIKMEDKKGSDQAHEPDEATQAGKPLALSEEVDRAVSICNQAKSAVKTMFSEARMGKALDAKDALPLVEEISNSVMRNPGALISVARLKNKDEYTYMHSVAVCALMVALARQLGFDDKSARLAGLLHDIGKITIESAVLNKPGSLNDQEWGQIKSHPQAGYDMLVKSSDMPSEVLDVCLRHHEKVDGSGYPGKLKDDKISLLAKMGAVCDVYDAITSERPYKRGWSPAEAIKKMAEWSKGHFDETVFRAFVKSIGIYPTGSLVKLDSKRLAVVCDQSKDSLLHPMVKVFYSIRSQSRVVPEMLDLGKSTDKIISKEIPEDWGFDDLENLWRS
jgi:putative nucleotidyltransferase with HDIG domain